MDEATRQVNRAIAELRAGRMVIVSDDHDRENEADLILPAEAATRASIGFMVRHTSGIICVGIAGSIADRLKLAPMVTDNTDPKATAFTVSIDSVDGTTTGISAADRARTIRALVDPASTPSSFTQPGHVFPLRARDEGVLSRRGHTEAAVDLCRLAGLQPAGVLSELVDDRGELIRGEGVRNFAEVHELVWITIDDLATFLGAASQRNVRHLHSHRNAVRLPGATRLPTPYGTFDISVVRDRRTRAEHVALVLGDPTDASDVLTRVHSECASGELFASLRCDCGPQLEESLRRIGEAGMGVVVYMRGHEGRGIGLSSKLAAYRLQDEGFDTVEANVALGLPIDDRDYGTAAQVLRQLRICSVRLMTNNVAKRDALTAHGVRVAGVEPLHVSVTTEQVRYLLTKRDRMGHDFSDHPDLRPIAGEATS